MRAGRGDAVIDAQGHTLRDERDELIAALREAFESIAAALAGRYGRLNQATERVRLAERALAAAPEVRRVEVEIAAGWRDEDETPYLLVQLPDDEDLDGRPIEDLRAVLLVPVRR